MASYFSKYQGRGGPAIAPGIVQMMGSIGDEYAKGIKGLSEGLEKYRQNKETRDILEETALNEYARQLPAEDEEVDPIKSEYLSQYGEKVRDASDMSMGELKGLVSSMQTDRNEMQKQKDYTLQEKLYGLKEREVAATEAKIISDKAVADDRNVLAGEKQIADIIHDKGMLGVAEAQNVIREDELTAKKIAALDKKTQASKTLEQNQTALRELFKNDTTSIGAEVQAAMKGDFDPEILRPWIDTKIKAMTDAAVTELDSYKNPVVHDLGGGNQMVTFGKTSHMMSNVGGKLQMSADKMEQLRTRANDSIADLMSAFPYAAELDRKDKDEDAPTPIQDQIDGLKDYDQYLIDAYGPNAKTQDSPTPAAPTTVEKKYRVQTPDGRTAVVTESDLERAKKDGHKVLGEVKK